MIWKAKWTFKNVIYESCAETTFPVFFDAVPAAFLLLNVWESEKVA